MLFQAIAFYGFKTLPNLADPILREMIMEMEERGFVQEGCLCSMYMDPGPHLRDGLASAIGWAVETNGAVFLLDMKGRGKIEPFLSFLARYGVPLIIPQIPTYPHGEPLTTQNWKEIRAWNDAEKSKVLSEAMKGKAKGGDTGYRPPASATQKARDASKQAAIEAAEERGPEVILSYTSEGTYTGAARDLISRGIPTPSGTGEWHSQMVKRTLERIGALK